MGTIILNSYSKAEINGDMVQFFELMGTRWVALGRAERWSQELIDELKEGKEWD